MHKHFSTYEYEKYLLSYKHCFWRTKRWSYHRLLNNNNNNLKKINLFRMSVHSTLVEPANSFDNRPHEQQGTRTKKHGKIFACFFWFDLDFSKKKIRCKISPISLSLSLSLTHTHSHTNTNTHTHTHTHNNTLNHTRTQTLSLSLTRNSHTHLHPSHTYTHTLAH